MLPVVERFIRYAKIHTESDRETGLVPSTPGQLHFLAKKIGKLQLSRSTWN